MSKFVNLAHPMRHVDGRVLDPADNPHELDDDYLVPETAEVLEGKDAKEAAKASAAPPSEVEDLKKQLKELQAQVAELSKPKA